MAYIKLFTKEPSGEEYPSALAYSVHMAYSNDGNEYKVFNQDYGMLFTKGVVKSDNTIVEKGVKYPAIFKKHNSCDGNTAYGIVAVRVGADGAVDDSADGTYQYWTTEDMVRFEDDGMCSLESIAADSGLDINEINDLLSHLTENEEYITEIPYEDIDKMIKIWMPVHNVGIVGNSGEEDTVHIHSVSELNDIRVTAMYSDGSTHEKKVIWDESDVEKLRDIMKSGKNESVGGTDSEPVVIHGTVENRIYPFPLAKGYADPVIFRYEDSWYFIATNDNTDDVGLFVRKADNIEDLFAEGHKEYLILDKDEDRDLIQTFWAPEFHMIGGELYILFAVGPKDWGPQCHMMKLKKGGSITDADSWEDPVRVRKMDGSFLCENGITLDMTYAKACGRSYVIWSERYHIGTPLDSGSMIYIGEIDENDPYQLISEPVLLTRPFYGWENQYGTINNEGPYALYTKDRLYIAYSGGSAGGYSYSVGFLSIEYDKNLLDTVEWNKDITPSLTAHSVDGEYGPGHNSFFTDENGDIWIAYHAKETIGFTTRCTAIRRVHFDVDGVPVLNMDPARDVDEKYAKISIKVNM